jgi:hypothetical protein
LSFACNARSAGWTAPGLPYHISAGPVTIFNEVLAPAGAGPYYQRYVVFSAPSAAFDLRFTSDSNTGDRSLLLDDIHLTTGETSPGNVAVPLTSSVFAGNALRLAWPASAPPGMRLQWSRTLQPGSWIDSTQPAVIEGTDYTIYEPMEHGRKFHRLLRP